jgi:TetR/AcrR family transcriptional repressor of nem operon
MRVTKEQSAKNRKRILHAAGVLIRERGISGVGVDALTEAAGLTHGSLYSQFGSKDRLAVEALRVALEQNAESVKRVQDLKFYVTQYLSARHRDAPGTGCVLAALGCEMSRASEAVRSGFTAGLRRMIDRVSELIGEPPTNRRNEEALAMVATMVGALILSRAVDDPQLANRILAACRKSLKSSGRSA